MLVINSKDFFENMRPFSSCDLTFWYHLLVVFLIMFLGAECYSVDDSYINGHFVLTYLLLVYVLGRFLYSLCPKLMSLILVVSVAFFCVNESYLGLTQLFGYNYSNHYLYAITGSYQNPGPYGGFLAVCISLLVAYCIKSKELSEKLFISKLFSWIIYIVIAIALIILPSTQSRSSLLALGCSMILLASGTEKIIIKIKPILKKYGIWLLIGGIVLGTSAYLLKKQSADGRFFMNRISIKTICSNGLSGAGFGQFGGAYGEAQARYFKKKIVERGKDDLDWIAIDEHDRLTSDCPDNAFNEYLFIGVEAGPIIMLLFIGMIVVAIVISFKRGTIWCYGLTAFAVFAIFSYPLHILQFQIIFPILLATCVSDREPERQGGSDEITTTIYKDIKKMSGLIINILLLVALSLTLVLKLPEISQHKKAESVFEKVERWHKMEYYDYVVDDCDTLLKYLNHDYRFLFAYGQSLNKTGYYEKSDSVLKMGTEISSDPMFWNVMGNNSLLQGKYREAEERYKHAFYMVPNRLYPLYLLAKLYYIEGDTARFLDMVDKVETFIPKVESVNTESLRSEMRELKYNYLSEVVKKDE